MVFSGKACTMILSMKKEMNCMKKNHYLWIVPLIVLLLVLCLACGQSETKATTDDNNPVTGEQVVENEPLHSGSEEISIITPEPDPHRDELNAILLRTTMLQGVTVNGVSVGGMTMDEARAAVLPSIEQAKKDMQVRVDLGNISETFSGESIPIIDNFDDALNEAFALVREDNGFEAVSAEVEAIKASGRDFPVLLTFNEEALRAAVDVFANEHETKPVNASVGYDSEKNEISYKPEIPGRTVDREALVSVLLNAKNGDTVQAPVETLPAEISLEDIQNKYVLRGTKTTKYGSSIKNRKYNIKYGAGKISGTVLHPGEVFSANGTLGVRNKANGWKVATAYEAGAHVKQYGGGVCQLSSTLYNAAVMADMKIVERRNHSMPVDYVSKGLDATINSTGNIIDFKFENSSKADIIIIAKADGKELTMEIWGIPIIEDSNGEYDEIRIPKPKQTKTLKPSGGIEYIVDESKPVGYKKEEVKNRNGSVWESKKEYYLNGVLVKTEKLDTSTYKAFAGVYVVGPDATPKPDNTSTPKPDDPTTPKPSDPSTSKPDDPTPVPSTPVPSTPVPDTPKPDTPKPTDPPSGGDDNDG